MDEMLQTALRLRNLGLAVHWLRPNSKIPVNEGWASAAAMSVAELKESYHPGHNVGFRPGKWSVVNGREICVLDVDVRGGPAYAEEAHCAAAAMLGSKVFDVISGSGVGRHRFLAFPPGSSPASAATTLRQSDVFIGPDGALCPANLEGARPAWLIELLSTGKNVVLPPSIHPETRRPYRQAQALGAQVRRGEQGTQVVFFKLLEVEGRQPRDAPSPADPRVVPLLRSFTVFNAAQVDGLPPGLLPPPPSADWMPVDEAEAVLTHSGADIRHGGDRAYYHPAQDLIQLPEHGRFEGSEAYYRVALHELTHWSGHDTRCNRPLQGRQHIEAYAFEELVAEIGSAFLCGHCGLPGSLQHASYVDHWLQALKSDRRLIFTAAAQAQKAADFILARLPVNAEEAAVHEQMAA